MDIKTLREQPFTGSKYLKPKRYTYEKGGKTHSWDFIEALDSVSVLLYHSERRAFVLVRQFRVPLWDYQRRNALKIAPAELGYSLELCSGLVDKALGLEQIAIEECVEELGYKPRALELVGHFYSGFGSGVSRQSIFFASVAECDRIGTGGGIDDEEIEAVFVDVADFAEQIKCAAHAVGLEFAHLWFMKNKASKFGL